MCLASLYVKSGLFRDGILSASTILSLPSVVCTFKRGGATLEDTNKKIHELQAPPTIVTGETDSRFTEHSRRGGQKKNGDGGNGSKGLLPRQRRFTHTCHA